MTELDRIVAAAREALGAGSPGAMATILATEGSSFRRAGTRLWIGAERCVGALSGGCIERDLAARAQGVVRSGRALLAPYDSAAEGDVLWGTASGCGGVLQILVEPVTASLVADLDWVRAELAERRVATLVTLWDGSVVTRRRGDASARPGEEGSLRLAETHLPPVALGVFGGGEDARAAARLARELGWRVAELREPAAMDAALAPGGIPLDARAAVLVMTHNFHRDADILERVGRSGAGYIGLLGPRRRAADLLAREGMPPAPREVLHAPPGLDIGGETPEEIALSLLAEIQAHFAGRDGGRLRDRAAPIHDRAPRPRETAAREA